jgi:LacI family transcriptional regulator
MTRYHALLLLTILGFAQFAAGGAWHTVTIREVAAAAGVSTATVSRVLSGNDRVNPELAARVQAVAGRLGYRANRVARALRRQSTQTVGLIVPDLTNPFFPAFVQAVEGALREAGFSLLLCDARNDVVLEAELVRNLFDHQIDGLLISVCDRIASRQAVRLAAGRLPVIEVDRRATDDICYVGADQAGAMAKVIGHLAAQGCERYAYITPDPAISTAKERLDGFLRLARRLDADVTERVYQGDFSLEWGYEAAGRIIARSPLPDAIVCANDLSAAGALRRLHEHGISVPADVAVTGFDDTVLAVTVQPELTTVRQPLEKLGHQAAAVLRAAIADPELPPRSAVLSAELVIRGSSLHLPATRHDARCENPY